MNTSQFDALVVVHPAFDIPKNSDYIPGLKAEVGRFCDQELPVFVVESIFNFGDCNIVEVLYGLGAYKLPEIGMLTPSGQVEFIARTAGKLPEEMTIAFGGMYASSCVYDVASRMCQQVFTNFEPDGLQLINSKVKFAKGVILDNIVSL